MTPQNLLSFLMPRPSPTPSVPTRRSEASTFAATTCTTRAGRGKARPPPHLSKEMSGSHTSLHIGLNAKSSQLFDAQALADTFRANKTLGVTITTSDRRSTTCNEGLQARALREGHGLADEPSVPWCHIYCRFGISAECRSLCPFHLGP